MIFFGYCPPLTQRYSYTYPSTPAQDDPTFSCRRRAREHPGRSISQTGGASLRRLFVKCELSFGGCEAAEYRPKCGLISAQHSRTVPGLRAFARRFAASNLKAPFQYRLLTCRRGGIDADQHRNRGAGWHDSSPLQVEVSSQPKRFVCSPSLNPN